LGSYSKGEIQLLIFASIKASFGYFITPTAHQLIIHYFEWVMDGGES
jgi:hypothetical protein